MTVMTYREALNQVLHTEMARAPDIFVCGEDISGGAGGTSGEREASGGIFGVTAGLLPRFGADRVIDTPISENTIVGMAAGASLAGKRGIAEIMFADFITLALDQMMNQAAKFRYMSGGKATCPLVIRVPYGAGMNMGAQHSQSMYNIVTSVPGLKTVIPTNAADAKGLLTTAIRDDDPVVFFEHKAMYGRKYEVPDGEYLIPFGQASLLCEGDDATIIAMGRMVLFAQKSVAVLKEEGIDCDLIDLRTTSPMDEDTILDSVEKTGRVIVVDECTPRCSLASDIAGFIASHGFSSLKAPVGQVTSPHAPVPFARELERAFVPNPVSIAAAVRKVVSYQ
ncbi:MAG: alpha-ketoacid dehydrogenase subunit beta [Hyphomonadaceae bacterium]|nr:alpha-ketoacid dehydrogenase subunit beta [Hyphomonadaceae bacterium]MBC6412039.1 alpha-ketoacid dehydrogenase subunit beta [Hyphomonadaceae bacterium]